MRELHEGRTYYTLNSNFSTGIHPSKTDLHKISTLRIILVTNRWHSGYVQFIQRRLSVLAFGFLFLYSAALSLAYLIRNETLASIAAWQHWLGFLAWATAYSFILRQSNKAAPHQDPYIIHLIYICCGWGLLVLWRLSPALGLRQTAWFLLGSCAFLLILRYPAIILRLKKNTLHILGFTLFLTFLTILPALFKSGGQPTLWLSFRGLTFQPSEPLKLVFIIYLSSYYALRHKSKLSRIAIILPSMFVALLSLLILLTQKDLGTTAILLSIYIVIVFLATGSKKWLAISAFVFILAVIIGYFQFDVIQLRVQSWINPWLQAEGRSYQVVQALIAQASGGILGTGPGMGSPHLVPVAASDFIFTAIAEETGIFGSCAVMLLLLFISLQGFTNGIRSEDNFQALLSMGISTWLIIQSLLIIGGNIRLLPLTGVTLPFFSYGGSSLLVCLISGAILTSISNNNLSETCQAVYQNRFRSIILPGILVVTISAFILLPMWSFINKSSLISRTDNIRRAIADFYVPRGSILDRNDANINTTIGITGELERIYNYPPLAATVGYNTLAYGQSGLEMALDSYLRGIKSYTDLELWWSNLLYSHPPTGKDIRLSIDLKLQRWLDQALIGFSGAGIVMNAKTGELLAVSSSPWYDPTRLDEQWDTLIIDKDSPLLNRAIYGKYPAGTALSPFLFAASKEHQINDILMNNSSLEYKGHKIACSSIQDYQGETLASQLQRGCPQLLVSMGQGLGKKSVNKLYSDLGFFSRVSFVLSTDEPPPVKSITNLRAAVIGQENVVISPLQMAMAAAAISAGGIIPSPSIVNSYQLGDGSWEVFPVTDLKQAVFSNEAVRTTSEYLSLGKLPAWGVVGQALRSKNEHATWFLGGTNTRWQGVPVVIVIVSEKDDPGSLGMIGYMFFQNFTSISDN